MKFHWDLIQNTDEWGAMRAGKITASAFKTFLVKGNGENGFGAGAFTELYKLVEGRITGEQRPGFSNSATDYGHINESYAAEAYEIAHFIRTKSVGFVEKDSWIGCSTDRLMPDIKKGLEIKCFPVKHIVILDTQQYGKDEYTQCQFSLWCTKYESWDLWYWHPVLAPVLFTFEPDKELFHKLDDKSKLIIEMAKAMIKKINK